MRPSLPAPATPRAALALLAVLALLAAAAPAAAHAVPVSSEPEQGARLATPPTRAAVTFSEPLERSGSWLRVEDSGGHRVDLDDLSFPSDVEMALSIKPDLPDGTYTIHWHTFAKDTHTLDSRIGFAVGAYDAPAGGGASYRPSGEAVAGRATLFAGLALAFGAAAWLSWLATPSLPAQRARALRALAVGAVLHLVGLLLLVHATALSSGLSPAGLLRSSVGKVFALRLVAGAAGLLLAGLALVPGNRSRTGPPLAILLLALAGIGSSDLSHSSKAGLPGVAVDAMHLLAGATWVGSLLLLCALLWSERDPTLDGTAVRRIGVRFGTLAVTCVVLLFLAGVVASAEILGIRALLHPLGLLGTDYGRFLLAKVALALAMVGLAGINRFVLLDPLGEDSPLRFLHRRIAGLAPGRTRRGLRRIVAFEATFGAAVLVLAGFLTATSPAVAAPGPHAATAQGDGVAFHYILDAKPAPRFGAESTLRLSVFDKATGSPVTKNDCGRSSCVELTLRKAGDNATGESHSLAPDGSGHWILQGVLWTFSGPAAAHLRMQTGGDVFQDDADLSFEVAP
jgi:copper transport protein